MTLAFSQALNGKLTHFPEKILNGLVNNELIKVSVYRDCVDTYLSKVNISRFAVPNKIHTIRRDEKNKWKPGNNIHFVIHNRTKSRYQFAPVVPCVSTQEILITWYWDEENPNGGWIDPEVTVDFRLLEDEEINQLAINDGFINATQFLEYFKSVSTDFVGKIIHWTDKKY